MLNTANHFWPLVALSATSFFSLLKEVILSFFFAKKVSFPTFGKLKYERSDIVEILDKLRILSLEAGAWTGKPSADDLLHPALN